MESSNVVNNGWRINNNTKVSHLLVSWDWLRHCLQEKWRVPASVSASVRPGSVPIHPCTKEKKLIYRIWWRFAPPPLTEGEAAGGMVSAARERLDTDYLVAQGRSKQSLPFLELNAETGFFNLKSKSCLNWAKALLTIHEFEIFRLIPVWAPLYVGFTVPFDKGPVI